MKMKRLLVIGLTAIIIACSGSENPQVQNQECFSTGEKNHQVDYGDYLAKEFSWTWYGSRKFF
jgi:hypothetical protein